MVVVCALALVVFIVFVVVVVLVFVVFVFVATVISVAVLLLSMANSVCTPFATSGAFWHLLLAFCAFSQHLRHVFSEYF